MTSITSATSQPAAPTPSLTLNSEKSIDSYRGKFIESAMHLVNYNKIIWIPHFLATWDAEGWPNCKITYLDASTCGHFWGKHELRHIRATLYDGYDKGKQKQDVESCFIPWLKSEENNPTELPFLSEKWQFAFMNCSDFVYSALYLSGALTKEQIKDVYQQTFTAQRWRTNTNAYFHFSYDHLIDLSQGEKGDIGLVLDRNGKASHVFILGDLAPDGTRQGIGVWNTLYTSYSEHQTELQNYVSSLAKVFPMDQMIKYCQDEKDSLKVYPLNKLLSYKK